MNKVHNIILHSLLINKKNYNYNFSNLFKQNCTCERPLSVGRLTALKYANVLDKSVVKKFPLHHLYVLISFSGNGHL